MTAPKPKYLSVEELEAKLGITREELREVQPWGLEPRPGEPGVRSDYFEDVINMWACFPGICLSEDFAAALVGLSATEFRKRARVFRPARTAFDPRLFWKHRLDAIYRAHLEPATAYSSLSASHRDFARRLGVQPARCVVCGEHAVRTICHECHQLVDPAHCEAVNDNRLPPFRPTEVCFNCIHKNGLAAFEFFRDRRSVRASVERVLGKIAKP